MTTSNDGYPPLLAGFNSQQGPARVGFPKPIDVRLDLTPYMGGYSVDAAAQLTHQGGTPAYVYANATGGFTIFRRPLPWPVMFNLTDDPSATMFTLTELQFRYYRANAADDISFRLLELSRDGASNETILESFTKTEFSTTGAATLYTATFSHILTPKTKSYGVRFGLSPNAAAADARISDVTMKLQIKGVI